MYLNRTKEVKKPIFMNNCSFAIKLFDNDRVTKLAAKNRNVKNNYQTAYNPKPVLNLFPWHEPSLYTEKLDLFKIMQHIREGSRSGVLTKLVASLNVSFSKSEKKKKAILHGYENFMRYHLVTSPFKRKEPLAANFPKWLHELNSSEEALMILAKSPPKFLAKEKATLIGDISKLYVKRKI
jgi:hypothetical protein